MVYILIWAFRTTSIDMTRAIYLLTGTVSFCNQLMLEAVLKQQ